MKSYTLKKSISIWFLVAMTVIVMNAVFVYMNFQKFDGQKQWVEHTYELIATLEGLIAASLDIQSAQRGYIITKEKEHLVPFNTAIPKIEADLKTLKELTADNPQQEKRAELLENLITRRIKSIERTIQVYETKGQQAAFNIIRTGAGKHEMDEIRRQIDEMIAEEKKLLTLRQREVDKASYLTLQAGIVGLAICIVILFLLFSFIKREMLSRIKAETKLMDSIFLQKTQEISENLKESQAKYKAILDNIVDGLITIDEEGMIQSYNKACEKIFGYEYEEVIGKNVKMLMPPYYAERHDQYLKNYLESGEAKIIGTGRELEGKKNDGTVFPMDLSVAEVDLGEGKRLFSGIVRDLTENKRNEARLSAILDNIVDGLITIDEKGIVESYNKACEKIFGYKFEEVIGQNVKMLMPQYYAEKHDGYLSNYANTGEAKIIGIGRELQGKRKNEGLFPMDLSVAEVKLGNKRFFSGIVRDITERKNAEDALKRTNEELEKFAYVASHDLKAPLRNIDNLAQWVIEDTAELLPDDSKEKLNLLRERILRLETLLDDILSYSRAGRIVDEPIAVNTSELIQQVAQTHIPDHFKFRMIGSLPQIVSSRTPLEQIFGNLFANAVKHHDQNKGEIEIEGIDRKNFIEFIIRDDGPGIPQEFHERVFEMFQTLKSRDKVSGSGLGMSIIKKLVEWQGGRVWIESEAGKRGTAVHFLWPSNIVTKAA